MHVLRKGYHFMAMDGLFIHHLLTELDLDGKKIYSISFVNNTDMVWRLSNKKTLLLSFDPSSAHMCYTSQKLLSGNFPLATYIKKHLDGSIIERVTQHGNDRIVKIELVNNASLGYPEKYNVYCEFIGRQANMIITTPDDVILEALKKTYITDERLIQVRGTYTYPASNQNNPFANPLSLTNLEGISKQTLEEIKIYGLSDILNRPTDPVEIGKYFYCFDLLMLDGERTKFPTLSALLEHHYSKSPQTCTASSNINVAKKRITQEINKQNLKLSKQNSELKKAKEATDLELKANLLLANINKIKKYQTEITLPNIYNNGELINITINPNLGASGNVNAYFNKIKKNKRTVSLLAKTILQTESDINYYNELLNQLSYVNSKDLEEMLEEISVKSRKPNISKPKYTRYIDVKGNIYLVGKNNIQNNYITHIIAKPHDYFVHVKSMPGSHVILQGELEDESIKIAANLATIFTKAKNSIHVCVDYTLKKWVKKIKGQKGSFVTYTHEKMTFVDPDNEFIEEMCKRK